MIKYAVMTFMYRGHIDRGDITHEQLVELVASAGGQGLEAFQRDFINEPELLPRYRKAMEANGVGMPVVDVIVNLVYTSGVERTARIDELRQGLDICAELGTEIAHVAGCKMVEGVSADDGRKKIAELLAECADYAQERDLILAIENFNPSPELICKAADCLEIMRLSGDVVKQVFDTGNFLEVDEQADEQLPLLYDRICHCHFKDFRLPEGEARYAGAVFGEGLIPNRKVAAELVRRGYDGWVALESYPQGGMGPREVIPGELATLKGMFE
ncbi:MAG: sugar phosphate isomerase/epimerase [Lentisphaeria bacterium]|nr:sugar phosphate isomerase/epimerase [Lentisphaeria bacterium]